MHHRGGNFLEAKQAMTGVNRTPAGMGGGLWATLTSHGPSLVRMGFSRECLGLGT